jgi:indolepyruvate ferredoxin oxidoreductase, beta subunit
MNPSIASTRNIVIGGLGGQGVLKASDIIAHAALNAGFDVKKSELHGMSQRGGSVSSDVRFGPQVLSPMIPEHEADFLLMLTPDHVEPHRHRLRPDGLLLLPSPTLVQSLPNRKSLNVAMLGQLSRHLDLAQSHWLNALRSQFPPSLLETNLQAFNLGCQH